MPVFDLSPVFIFLSFIGTPTKFPLSRGISTVIWTLTLVMGKLESDFVRMGNHVIGQNGIVPCFE